MLVNKRVIISGQYKKVIKNVVAFVFGFHIFTGNTEIELSSCFDKIGYTSLVLFRWDIFSSLNLWVFSLSHIWIYFVSNCFRWSSIGTTSLISLFSYRYFKKYPNFINFLSLDEPLNLSILYRFSGFKEADIPYV